MTIKASQFLSSVCRAILFLWLICRVCLSVHCYLTVFHGTCVLKRFREGGFQTQLYSALMPCTPHYSTWRRKRLRDSKSVGLVVSHAAWGRAIGTRIGTADLRLKRFSAFSSKIVTRRLDIARKVLLMPFKAHFDEIKGVSITWEDGRVRERRCVAYAASTHRVLVRTTEKRGGVQPLLLLVTNCLRCLKKEFEKKRSVCNHPYFLNMPLATTTICMTLGPAEIKEL